MAKPAQVIAPTMIVPLPVVDLHPLPPTQREAEALHLARREAQRPFDLAGGPLLRARLIRLDAGEHFLLVVMHHIVTDGWSMDLFWQELATLYGAYVGGHPSPLPELPIQYADFAIWQRRWLTGEVLDDQSWLLETPACARSDAGTPHGSASPSGADLRGGATIAVVPPASDRRAQGAEPPTWLHPVHDVAWGGAFTVLLHRYTGQDDLVLGSPISNRNHPEIEGLIGFFVNTLALRIDLSGNPTFVELLQRVRGMCLDAMRTRICRLRNWWRSFIPNAA